MIIVTGMIVGLILGVGLYIAQYVGFVPFGKYFNEFFGMVGIIIFLISGFFFMSMRAFQK